VSSESSTVHTISGSSEGSNNPTSIGKGWSKQIIEHQPHTRLCIFV
jgi:hypothetical protein